MMMATQVDEEETMNKVDTEPEIKDNDAAREEDDEEETDEKNEEGEDLNEGEKRLAAEDEEGAVMRVEVTKKQSFASSERREDEEGDEDSSSSEYTSDEEFETEPDDSRLSAGPNDALTYGGGETHQELLEDASDQRVTSPTQDNNREPSASPDRPQQTPPPEAETPPQQPAKTAAAASPRGPKDSLAVSPEKHDSDLLSSDDEGLLLHRPDFYSILSDDDSFEWTFHNAKFSDLDIKFIPRVEERWTDAKARTSLKGNTSTTPDFTADRPDRSGSSPAAKEKSEVQPQAHGNNSKTFTDTTQQQQPDLPALQILKIPLPNSGQSKQEDKYLPKKRVQIKFTAEQQKDIMELRNLLNENLQVMNTSRNQAEREPEVTVPKKKPRPPSIRNNVVFFQSSPTLTYKKTKLKFLPATTNDSPRSSSSQGHDDDHLVWSTTARLTRDNPKPAKPPKPELSMNKLNEIFQKRHAHRKLHRLDEIEARFISGGSTFDLSREALLYSTSAHRSPDQARTRPNIVISSTPRSEGSHKDTSRSSSQQTHDSLKPLKPMKMSEVDRAAKRRSTQDVMKWLSEDRVSDGGRLRRDRLPDGGRLRRRGSLKDLVNSKKWQKMVGSKPGGGLRNWRSFPPGEESDTVITSSTDPYFASLKPLEYFRRWARMVCLMLRAVGLKPEKVVTTNPNFLSWTVVYDEVLGISRLNYDRGTLTFDPEVYKPNRELTIRPDVREILRLSPDDRTDAQVQTAMKCLQHVVPAFSEFPVRVQQSMLKVCRHEEFESGRVIIRQGHRAENFYFIVSGRAVVTVMDSGENHVHTANFMGKGSSFGDLAFLNMAKRSATVTCRDTVEVICIERDDFINIFLRGVKGKEPAHFTFLRGVDILQGWPVEALPQDNPKICAYTYVRRGVILSHDSATCEWIVVVVSGTCNIIKAMKDPGIKPQGQARSSLDATESQSNSNSSRKSIRDNMSSPASSVSSNHGNSPDGDKSSNKRGKLVHFSDATSKQKTKTPSPGSRANRLTSRNMKKLRHELVLADLNLDSNRSLESASAGQLEAGSDTEKHLAEIEKIFNKKHVLPSIKPIPDAAPRQRKTAMTLPPTPSDKSTLTLPTTDSDQRALTLPTTDPDKPSLTLPTSRLRDRRPSILRPHRLSTGIQPLPLSEVVVLPAHQEEEEREEEEETKVKDAGRSPRPTGEKVFIEVAHLEEGDVFGLEHVLLGNISDVTSCSLVSAGAEVVLINRKFFQKHLSEETAKNIREKIRPIPSEASLQAQLRLQMSWQAYKEDMLSGRQTSGPGTGPATGQQGRPQAPGTGSQQHRPGGAGLGRQNQVMRHQMVGRPGYSAAPQMS